MAEQVYTSPVRYSTAYRQIVKNVFGNREKLREILDEAHRMMEQVFVGKDDGNFIERFLELCRVAVFFCDEKQSEYVRDYVTKERIYEIAAKNGISPDQIMERGIGCQHRCQSAAHFLSLVEQMLEPSKTENLTKRKLQESDEYAVALVHSPEELFEVIREKNAARGDGDPSRVVAGKGRSYGADWTWVYSNLDYDGEKTIAPLRDSDEKLYTWNFGNYGARRTFATDEKSVDLVGCIDTSQGIGFEYVGVILAPDLIYNRETKQVEVCVDGHSGMGKSTLALQIAQNISAQGIPVFYYSLEMSKAGIAAKALARQIFRQTGGTMSIASSDLMYEGSVSGFGEAVWKEIEAARSDVAKECRELFVIEKRRKAPISGYRIYQDGVKYAEKAHAVVFVDYLQVLDLEEAENAARGGIVDPRSAIEYSADVVLAMQFGIFSGQEDLKNGELLADREKSKNPRVVDVIALKQRYGCNGEDAIVRFHYYAGSDCFQAIANQAPLAAPAKKRRRKSAEKEIVSAAQPAEPNPDYDTDWMKECE